MDGSTGVPTTSYKTDAIIAGSAMALAAGIAVAATRNAKAPRPHHASRPRGLSGILLDSGLVTPKDAADIIAHFHVLDDRGSLILVLTQYFPYSEKLRKYIILHSNKMISSPDRTWEFEAEEREEFERHFDALLRKKFDGMIHYVRFSGDIRTITDEQVTKILTEEVVYAKNLKNMRPKKRRPRRPMD